MRVMVASLAVLLLAAIASPAASQCVFSNGECFTSSDFLQVLGERFLASVSCFNASPCGSTAEFECVARNVSVDGEASSLCFSTLSPASTTAEVGELLSQCTALETEAACNAQAPPCAWGSGICGPQPSYLLAAVAGSTPEAADEWMRTGSVAQNICRGSTTRAECEGASDEVEEETGVALPEPRRLNRLQATHTHNSFHQTPVDKVLGLFGNPTLITNLPPSAFVNYPDRLEYSHPPLDEQLEEYSVRSLELDLLWDPEGGRYAGRAGVKLSDLLSRTTGQEDQWTETDPAWYAPEEFKVLDVPDSNAGTSCVRLAECLELVAAWSTANPEHLPITIWIEFGKVSSASVLGPSVTTIANNVLADGPPPNALAEPVPFQPEFILEAEAVMVEVLGEDSIVTPTSLKGDSATLSEAVLESQGGQWPTVDEVRGKIMLVLDPSASDALLDLHPGLNGSYFFPSTSVESRADNPEAAFVVYSVPGSSDPDYFEAVGEGAEIADDIVDADVAEVVTLVQEGYLVRAPTDSELIEARGEYTYRRDRMREAGVHYLETDVVAASSVPFNTSYIGGFILSETAGS